MTRHRRLLTIAFLPIEAVVTICADAADSPLASADAAWEAVAASVLQAYYEHHPTQATELGLHPATVSSRTIRAREPSRRWPGSADCASRSKRSTHAHYRCRTVWIASSSSTPSTRGCCVASRSARWSAIETSTAADSRTPRTR